MKLIQPTLLDLLALTSKARPDEIEQYEALVGPWSPSNAAVGYYLKDGLKFGLVDADDVVVCAAGWDQIFDGVYHGWMIGTMEYWDRYWRSITKQCRYVMDQMLKDGARRLQLGCLPSRTKACEWYERGLLMKREGVYSRFGRGGEPMAIYARFQEQENG